MERDQRQQARAEAGAARQRAEAEEEALQQAEEEARQQEGEARQQAEEAKHQVQRRMSFEEEYRRDEELQLQHQVQRLRVREAPTAAEQLAEQQLKYLRKKMQAELLKEINAVGKFLSNGENSGKILRALKLAIADQINAGWIDPPPPRSVSSRRSSSGRTSRSTGRCPGLEEMAGQQSRPRFLSSRPL